MKPYSPKATRIAVTLCIGALMLTGVALAQDTPAKLPETEASLATTGGANNYITQLDELRAMSQRQAAGTPDKAAGANENATANSLQRHNGIATGPHQPTANDYVTALDELRSMARSNLR